MIPARRAIGSQLRRLLCARPCCRCGALMRLAGSSAAFFTVAVQDMRGQSSRGWGRVGNAALGAGALFFALSSLGCTEPAVGKVPSHLCVPAMQVAVLFDSSTSIEKQHFLLKLSASCARCAWLCVKRPHGSRSRCRVLLSSSCAVKAHQIVSLPVRLCVTPLDSGRVLGRIGRVCGRTIVLYRRRCAILSGLPHLFRH